MEKKMMSSDSLRRKNITKEDLPACLSLWNSVYVHDKLTDSVLFEKIFQDTDFDEALTELYFNYSSQIIGLLQGVIRDNMGFLKLICFTKESIVDGEASKVMTNVEAMFKERGVDAIRIFEGAPNYLHPGIDVRYTREFLFLESLGYKRFDTAVNMIAPLDEALDVEIERLKNAPIEAVELRRAKETDLEAVINFVRNHWEGWEREVINAFKNSPISLHIALSENRILGFSAHDCNNVGTGWFGPMGTEQKLRGKGIGQHLLLRCLEDIKEQGHQQAIIPWVGPVGFYTKFCNATISRVFYRYEKKISFNKKAKFSA